MTDSGVFWKGQPFFCNTYQWVEKQQRIVLANSFLQLTKENKMTILGLLHKDNTTYGKELRIMMKIMSIVLYWIVLFDSNYKILHESMYICLKNIQEIHKLYYKHVLARNGASQVNF